MTKPNSQKDGFMNENLLAKIRSLTQDLTHHKRTMQAIGGNPYDGVSTQELRDLMAVVCPAGQALINECTALSQEIQRREPPE